ncbi:hypothetical protein PMAYCL1PPCAC_14587, partial [Pristionchus mayeri]
TSSFRYGQTTRFGCGDYVPIVSNFHIMEIRFTLSNIVGIRPSVDFTDPSDPCHNVAFVFDDKGETLC